jgi:molybdopterin molybdotransferase
MMDFAQAKQRILERAPLMPGELVSLHHAVGRVLAEPVVGRRDQPPHAVSAMDGYAVRAQDLADGGSQLEVSQIIPAGALTSGPLAPGQAARIFTGAPLPEGADAILIQELVQGVGGDVIRTQARLQPGRYVRAAGQDFAQGQEGLAINTRLQARHIGLAAAMNYPWLKLRRRPRVALISTGDELVHPGEPLGAGQIISANCSALAALVEQHGGEALILGATPDRKDSLLASLEAASAADIIVTSGGASVGDHDLVSGILRDNGLAVDFWKIAMRPGKPLIFGDYNQRLLIGLPGNPVSALMGGLMFLVPLLARMLAQPDPTEAWQTRRLASGLPANDERLEFLRARLLPDGQVEAFNRQDSAMSRVLAQADGLIRRPVHAPAWPAGTTVDYLDINQLL